MRTRLSRIGLLAATVLLGFSATASAALPASNQYNGTPAGAVAAADSSQSYGQKWTVPKDPSNPWVRTEWGQCTYWALEKRPDLAKVPGLANATTWAVLARSDGYSVNGSPQVGDIAVWRAGYAGSGAAGHVAYVEAVGADGSITVSEMNGGYGSKLDSRYVAASVVSGLQFIHQTQSTSATEPRPPAKDRVAVPFKWALHISGQAEMTVDVQLLQGASAGVSLHACRVGGSCAAVSGQSSGSAAKFSAKLSPGRWKFTLTAGGQGAWKTVTHTMEYTIP